MNARRKGQIAYMLLVVRFSKLQAGKLFSKLLELCNEAGIPMQEREKFKIVLVWSIEEYGAQASFELPKEEFLEMAWKLVVRYEYHEGVRLGDNTHRIVGSESNLLGISVEEGMEFSDMLVLEMHKIIFRQAERSVLGKVDR